MTSLIKIPATWDKFSPLDADQDWQRLGGLARATIASFHAELASLLNLAESWPLSRRGPQGESALLQSLSGWGSQLGMDAPGRGANSSKVHQIAHLPLPGEPAWNGEGYVEPWALPAALLIARGADPFEKDAEGVSALSRALMLSSAALVDQMLRLPHAPAVDEWPKLLVSGSNGYSAQYRSPMHAAAFSGDTLLLRTLVAHGAPVDQRDQWGRTPLMASPKENAVKALLELGADPLAEDAAGTNALERWSIYTTILEPSIRDIWVKAARSARPDGVRRVKRAALFGGYSTVSKKLSRIECDTNGRIPSDAWTVLGTLMRESRSGEDLSTRLESLNLSREGVSPLARALGTLTVLPPPLPIARDEGTRKLLRDFFTEWLPRWEREGWPLGRMFMLTTPLLSDPLLVDTILPILTDSAQRLFLEALSDYELTPDSSVFLLDRHVEYNERQGLHYFGQSVLKFPPNHPCALRASLLALTLSEQNYGLSGWSPPSPAGLSSNEFSSLLTLLNRFRGSLTKGEFTHQAHQAQTHQALDATFVMIDAMIEARNLDGGMPLSESASRRPRF